MQSNTAACNCRIAHWLLSGQDVCFAGRFSRLRILLGSGVSNSSRVYFLADPTLQQRHCGG